SEVVVAMPSSVPKTPDLRTAPVENSAGAHAPITTSGAEYTKSLNGGNEIVPKTKSPSCPRFATTGPLSPVTSDTPVPTQSPLTSRGAQGLGQVQAAVHAPSHGVPVAPPSHSSLGASLTIPAAGGAQGPAQVPAAVPAPSPGVPAAPPSHSSLGASLTIPSPQNSSSCGGSPMPGSSRLRPGKPEVRGPPPRAFCA